MRKVALLNRNFKAPAQELVQLWKDSKPLTHGEFDDEKFDRRRLSHNGRWVLRQTETLHPEHHADVATREFKILQRAGLDIVSFAHVPIGRRRVITIAPFIANLSEATETQFNQYVKPILAHYFEDAAGLPREEMYLSSEIVIPDNYSTLPGTDKPFLHDVDPSLHQGPSLAQTIAKRLSK